MEFQKLKKMMRKTTKNYCQKVNVGEVLSYKKLQLPKKFTKPAARYTEAALVRKLEELGIGRPSTYAPTIQTIQNRGYVDKEKFFHKKEKL